MPGGDDVFVGVQVGKSVVDVVAASEASARWTVDVNVAPAGGETASSTCRGEPVRGPRVSLRSAGPS